MSINLRVDTIEQMLGAPDFVKAFFSTVSVNLEPEGWGSRFPKTMGPFYQGALTSQQAADVRRELSQIRSELSAHPVSDLVWDFENRSARPPWGDDIADSITDLGNYFVTMNGHDLFEILDDGLSFSERSGYPATLVTMGVTVGDGVDLATVEDPRDR